ncbi:MAG: type VII toxin-antitoxin system MntA family adenylyltransferase antitoxin [Burkholderiales bacterium]
MSTFKATAAKNRFGRLLEACAEGPVAIERHGRVVAHLVAPKDFDAANRPLAEQLAARLAAAGAKYAAIFGSVARGEANPDSDLDLALSFGKPMSADLRAAMIGLAADVAGRAVDLVDLETAPPLLLERALRGSEILCDAAATRQRMIRRLIRTEDDRRVAALAARLARKGLFA